MSVLNRIFKLTRKNSLKEEAYELPYYKYKEMKERADQLLADLRINYQAYSINNGIEAKQKFLKSEKELYEFMDNVYIDAMLVKSIRADIIKGINKDYWGSWLESATNNLRRPLRVAKKARFKVNSKLGVVDIEKYQGEYPKDLEQYKLCLMSELNNNKPQRNTIYFEKNNNKLKYITINPKNLNKIEATLDWSDLNISEPEQENLGNILNNKRLEILKILSERGHAPITKGLTKKQSITWVVPKFNSINPIRKSKAENIGREFTPPVFSGFNRQRKDKLVGVIFRFIDINQDKKILDSTVMDKDGLTYWKPYYFETQDKAKQFLAQNKFNKKTNKEGYIYSNRDELFQYASDKEHNETLARIFWDKNDPGCEIGIFSDNLGSRLLGQLRSIDVQHYLCVPWVPISFYLPKRFSFFSKKKVFFYEQEEKDADLQKALNSKEPYIKAMALIISLLSGKSSSIIFDNISVKEQDAIISLLQGDGLTKSTKIIFFEKLLDLNIGSLHVNKFIKYVSQKRQTAPGRENVSFKLELSNIALSMLQNSPSYNINDLKSIDEEGNTALMLAVKSGNLETVKLLVVKSTIDIQNKKNKTALMLAVENGDIEMVKLLLDKANTEAKDVDGNTALMLAVESGNVEIIKLLSEKTVIQLKKEFSDGSTEIKKLDHQEHFETCDLELASKQTSSKEETTSSRFSRTEKAFDNFSNIKEEHLKKVSTSKKTIIHESSDNPSAIETHETPPMEKLIGKHKPPKL